MARPPLDGVRVADFTGVWAGSYLTMILGDLGAEVIKIENPYVMQPNTRGMAHPPPAILETGRALASGYPDRQLGPRPWNYCPTYVALFRNKKSFTVDYRRPEGLDVLGRLVRKCDVFVENSAVGTMERLGIDYDWLCDKRPDIVALRMPAFGSDGEYREARAFGIQMEAVIGHTLLRSYPDLDPSQTSMSLAGDQLAGNNAVLAILMALWHRDRTGRGQLIEMAQAENATAMLGPALMEYELNGQEPPRAGNRSIYGHAPQGLYPCRAAGPVEEAGDRWIGLSVTCDEEWEALRREMGDPEWARDPKLAHAEGRRSEHDRIDSELGRWTAAFADYDLFHRLQAAGVPCAPVLEASRVHDDPQVAARGLFEPRQLQDDIGSFRYMAPFLRFPETPVEFFQSPVAFGEHNEYVYRELLGVDDEEYERLRAAGHIRQEFDESVP